METSKGGAMPRILQIAASEAADPDGSTGTLYALCEDGSIWFVTDPWRDKRVWLRLETANGAP